MAETSYSIPVYRGWPEKPYQVLGSIRFVDRNKYWDDGIISAAAGMGKRNGGNAIVIRQGSEFGVGKITGAKNEAMTVFAANETTALVVRWLSESELAEQERLKREVLAAFPNVAPNQEVAELVFRYLRQSGMDPSSGEMKRRFVETMQRVSTGNADSVVGEWVYKGTLIQSALGAEGDDSVFLGMATITLDGDSVAVVSDAGVVEMNFSGSLNKGRLAGQVGIGTFVSKCEGAALKNKISLSFQSATPDGTVRGFIVFERLQNNPNPKHDENTRSGSTTGG